MESGRSPEPKPSGGRPNGAARPASAPRPAGGSGPAGSTPSSPRGTARWKKLYRLRGSVEREFGRLKNEWALLPLRVRRIERFRLHADLTILAQLATALAKARAVPLAT
jgi:Transposase DDE domain